MNLIRFSENGYYILVSTVGGKKASVLDLRNSEKPVVKDFEFEAPIDAATFDRTGKYILISAGGIHLLDASKFVKISHVHESGPLLHQLK